MMKFTNDTAPSGRTVYKRHALKRRATLVRNERSRPSAAASSNACARSKSDGESDGKSNGELDGKVSVKLDARPRRLLLCLDGVPYSVIKQARERGMFEMFNEPSRLLSPFPTMTNVALSTMLNATAPAGYESLYFDCDERRLAGGISKYVGARTPDKIPSSYMDALDYQEPLPCEFLVYLAPDRICFADFQRFAARFRRHAPQQDFFAFIKATDGLLHIRGAEKLQTALIELDRVLRDIRARHGAETEIVLFSDHGMNLEENRRIALRKQLESCGFEWARRLDCDTKRQVVVPAFGLCGYAALYTANDAQAREAADALTSLEGVDFSLTRTGSAARVASRRGVALIDRRTQADGVSYAYDDTDGDPLDLAHASTSLRKLGKMDAAGFSHEDDWFAATANHRYPDAPANLYGAIFDSRVKHTADCLVSLDDGYYYGATAFGYLARRLFATHGNALAASTNAFLMSTSRKFPSIVRAREAECLLKG